MPGGGSTMQGTHFTCLPVHPAFVVCAVRTTPDHPIAIAVAGAVVGVGRETLNEIESIIKSACVNGVISM